ncbi:hypothetical protein Tco_0746141 [Tanacetum coccineum]
MLAFYRFRHNSCAYLSGSLSNGHAHHAVLHPTGQIAHYTWLAGWPSLLVMISTNSHLERSEKIASSDEDRWLLLRRVKTKCSRFLRWVEAKMVSPEVENEKWRRLLLHWKYVAFDVSIDGRKEDFFPEMECSGSIVVSISDIVTDYNKALSDT